MRDSYVLYADKLQGEYRETFDRVNMYVGTQGIDDDTREEHMGQLLDMMLSAQESGKPVKKVVGNDVEAFCKAFCSEFSWKNRVLNILDTLRPLMVGLLIVSVIDLLDLVSLWADGKAVDVWKAAISPDLCGYLLGIVVSFTAAMVCNLLVRMFMFRTNRFSMGVLKGVTYAVAAAGFVLSMMLIFGNKDTVNIPLWIVVGGSAAYLVGYRLCNRKRIQDRKRQKVTFGDMVNEEMRKTMPETLRKRFERINRRRVRRGKEAFSMEEYLDWEEARLLKEARFEKFFFPLFPLVIIACCLPHVEFEDGLWDLAFYLGIMLVLEYALFMALWRSSRKNSATWLEAIANKRTELASEN